VRCILRGTCWGARSCVQSTLAASRSGT
jgi:hypothetical protein